MRQVFINLGVQIVGEVPDGCLLEGGDFMILNPSLAVLGLGMRTNMEAAKYLMENDLLGCERLALIIDENDMAQERMHLDTYFNILTDKTVVLLDFDSMGNNKQGKPLRRRVVVFEKNKELLTLKKKKTSDFKIYGLSKNASNDEALEIETKKETHYGLYKMTAEYDNFVTFLEKDGYKICFVNLEQQRDYITNFLNIGNNNVISVCRDLEKVCKKYYIDDVLIDYLDFTGVKKLYGAIHCASQVSRGCIFKVDHHI